MCNLSLNRYNRYIIEAFFFFIQIIKLNNKLLMFNFIRLLMIVNNKLPMIDID